MSETRWWPTSEAAWGLWHLNTVTDHRTSLNQASPVCLDAF